MIKVSNVFSLNLSDKAIIVLQRLGFLNGKKQVIKNRNLSNFISCIILKSFGYANIEERYLLFELNRLQIERDGLLERYEKDLSFLARRLSTIKKQANSKKNKRSRKTRKKQSPRKK